MQEWRDIDEVQGHAMSENNEETKTNMEDDDSGPITAKRQVERLDYKKLHDVSPLECFWFAKISAYIIVID